MKYNQPTTTIVCLGVQQMVMQSISSGADLNYDPSTQIITNDDAR